MARIQALPQPVNLDLYHQDSFALTLEFKDTTIDDYGYTTKTTIDTTGWVYAAAWRPNLDDPRSVAWQFIERNDSTGTVVLEITPAMFTSMKAISPSGVWDLQVTFPDTSVQTMLSGHVFTGSDVTP